MEHQIKPGIFLTVITQDRWFSQTEHLTREELTDFIMKCTPLRLANSSFLIDEDITPEELKAACIELEPEVDFMKDYYCIRRSASS